MTLLTYLLTIYLMMCIVAIVIVRAAVSEPVLRTTFVLIGCLAPFFAIYILLRTVFSAAGETSQEENEQILKSAEEIEQQRVKRFGGSLFQLREKIKVKYIHALNETAETIERVVVRAA